MANKRPYIWLQENEASGQADCGCRLEARMDGPAFWLCPMHKAAPELLKALSRLMPLWERDDVKETYDGDFEFACRVITRARRRQGRNEKSKKAP